MSVDTSGMERRTAYTLYACHALSTWNARAYEFAAIIFTASAYPGGLTAASFIGITTSIAAILFASSLGRWIDNAPSRLRTLITTFAVNRCAIMIACFFWFPIVSEPSKTSFFTGGLKTLAFYVILLAGIIESLSRKANVLSIERDWVPILAPPMTSGGYDLAHVNAIMSRIDIGCKLVAPIAVSGLSSVVPPQFCVGITAMINGLSFGLEFWTAQKVWDASPSLHKSKLFEHVEINEETAPSASAGQGILSRIEGACSVVAAWWYEYIESFALYFSTGVWRASLAMTMTQPSVLSVTGVLVVFLLNSGYSLKVVTVAEAISAMFELSSTFVTPFAISRSVAQITPRMDIEMVYEVEGQGDDLDLSTSKGGNEPTKIAVTKVAFGGITFMLIVLIPTLPLIFYLTHTLPYPIPQTTTSPTFHAHALVSIVLLFCLAASRLGRGIFSLTTQQLSQSQVPPSHRSSFGGTEQVFVSVFGLSHNIGSAIFGDPREFGWLTAGSLIALTASAGMFGWWMYIEGIGVGRWKSWNKTAGYEAVTLEGAGEDEDE